jgi:Putative rhamnosyl transferase
MKVHHDLTHLVLTRFNTAVDFAPSGKGLNRDWLENRLSLFEQYCLPSVAGQRIVKFTWLVFCDAASPPWFKEKMQSYRPLLLPVYIDGPATDYVIANAVRKTGLVSTPYLATTRLDNDDALGNNYLASVQRAFRHQRREFIVFPFGLQSFQGYLYNIYWPSNPFLTLIEKVQADQSFTTVLCVPHDKVRSAGAVRSIICPPQWLQVLHGSNLINTLGGWPRISFGYPSNFSVNWPIEVSKQSVTKRATLSATAFLKRGKRVVDRKIDRLRNA